MGNSGSNTNIFYGNYQITNKSVYYNPYREMYNRKKISLKSKNFIYYGDNHCKDNTKIFYKTRIIEADYLTWNYLRNNYSIDIFNVYYKGTILRKADVKSFYSPIRTNNEHGFDKKYNYFFGQRIKIPPNQ